MMVDAAVKQVTPIGKPGIIWRFSTSPDGNYILVERIKQPFSYLVPYRYFPQSVEVWDINGNPVKTIADIPLENPRKSYLNFPGKTGTMTPGVF